MVFCFSYLQGLHEVMAPLHFGFVVGHRRRLHLSDSPTLLRTRSFEGARQGSTRCDLRHRRRLHLSDFPNLLRTRSFEVSRSGAHDAKYHAGGLHLCSSWQRNHKKTGHDWQKKTISQIRTISICYYYSIRTALHQESGPVFNPNPAFLLVQKLKSAPRAFYTRSQGWNRKKLFNLHKVTNKCWTLWPCIGPKAEKKDTIKFGRLICNPWGLCSSIY